MTEALEHEPEDVAGRLARLDLSVADLLSAVRSGVSARRTATLNHPPTHGGQLDYGERVALLRETLIPRGWTRRNDRNMCFVDHPRFELTVMTALASSGCGTAGPVTTQRARGEVTRKVVQDNAQLEFDLGLADLPQPTLQGRRTPIPTWVLLVHPADDEIRSELSRPRHIDDDGYIDTWVERIPLPSIRINDELTDDGIDEGPGYDFEVPEL